jgi:hypothetical protein
MSTLARTSNAQFFYACLKSWRFIPSRAVGLVGPPMIQFISLKSESQDPEFQKEYLKLVGGLPRDAEIVARFKRISDERMIAKA